MNHEATFAQTTLESDAATRHGSRLKSLTHPLNRIIARLEGRTESTNGFEALCPAHDDHSPSLSVGHGQGGRLLLTCHAGCELTEICDSLGITESDLFVLAEYTYHDDCSAPIFQVVRATGKRFWQRRPDEQGDWVNNLKGVRPVLYRLPEVLEIAKAGGRIYVVEGEKDTESLVALGAYATTNPGGAGHWRPEFTDCLRGADVVILPDHDKAGHDHAEEVAQSLAAAAIECRIVNLPGLAEKQDVSDWLKAGGSLEELSRLADSTPEWKPVESAFSVNGKAEPSPPGWPDPLKESAFNGLAGEIVRTIEPETEGDPAAVLANVLVMFGNAVGRGPFIRVGAEHHYANLFAVLVGATSAGRKGTSARPVRAAMAFADPEWERDRVATGLSSGEGLVFHVRDDQGERDKRLLVIEEEFVSTLRMLERTGNTLSPVLREAWDNGNLQTLTKKSALRARNAHVSVMAHITPTELRNSLRSNEMWNGFAPRFLWLAVKRSKLLPSGGQLSDRILATLGAKLAERLETAKGLGEIRRSKKASALWADHYERLTSYGDDLCGVVLSRSAPQVLRLALVYALLDGCTLIKTTHLKAALELWRYCEDSVRVIFGKPRTNQVAEQIREALKARPEGMTRTEISGLFHGSKTSEEITVALQSLGAQVRMAKVETGGRREERWFSV